MNPDLTHNLSLKNAFIYVFLILFLTQWTGFSEAASKDSYAASFLEISPGARLTALSGAQATAKGHLEYMFSNPASLTSLDVPEILIGHNKYLFETNYETLGFGFFRNKWGCGISGHYLGDSSIRRMGVDSGGSPVYDLGEFRPYVAAGNLSLAYQWHARFSMGATLKGWSEHLDKRAYQGFAGDIGLLATPLNSWDLGLVARNVGPDIEGYPLPTSVGLGVAKQFNKSFLPISLMTEFNSSEKSDVLRLGIELNDNRLFSLRGGYSIPLSDNLNEVNPLTFGAGLRFRGWQLDYAWKAVEDLGDTHTFSITIGLGLSSDEKRAAAQALDVAIQKRIFDKQKQHMTTGDAASKQQSWDKAEEEYKQALYWDPLQNEARTKLQYVQLQKQKYRIGVMMAEANEHIQQHKWIDATLSLQEVLRLDPNNAPALKLLSTSKRRISEGQKTSHVKDMVLSKTFNQGIDYYIEGHFEQALKAWKIVIQSEPSWPGAQEYAAKAQSKFLEQKIALQSKKQSINGHNAETLSRNAYTYFTLGNIEEAIKTWEKVLVLDPGNTEATWALKEARNKKDLMVSSSEETDRRVQELNSKAFNEYSTGQLQNAILIWNKALRIDPRNSKIRNNIQRVQNELVLKESLE